MLVAYVRADKHTVAPCTQTVEMQSIALPTAPGTSLHHSKVAVV